MVLLMWVTLRSFQSNSLVGYNLLITIQQFVGYNQSTDVQSNHLYIIFRCHQPINLSKAQVDDLRELWEAGLTSLGDKEKISEAMEFTGLAEKTIEVC